MHARHGHGRSHRQEGRFRQFGLVYDPLVAVAAILDAVLIAFAVGRHVPGHREMARADRLMAEEAGDLSALRTPARIRRLIELRLTRAEPHREALRQAAALLALPWNAPLAACLLAETVDAMWIAAGDVSADISRHTRRATLAAELGLQPQGQTGEQAGRV